MKQLLLSILLTSFTIFLQAQHFSAAGSIAWNVPIGAGVGANAQQFDVDGGITYGLDLLYYGNAEDPKIGVGIVWNTINLGTEDSFDNAVGFHMLGVKGVYHTRTSGFAPYFGISVGAAQLSTPEVIIGDQVILEAERSTSLALTPQFGLALGGFQVSVDYMLPANFELKQLGLIGQMGSLSYSAGYRQRF